jgi:sucrose-6-phosphate hydrolase SacC (GH32 family)
VNSIEFETELAKRRLELYRHQMIDIINEGFRPLSGMPADFCVVQGEGRYHFFYIERRLAEGTPFFPGHEIYFGHASTADLYEWEVHDPAMLIRPGTWEGAHVWAPYVLPYRGAYIMAYTGVNRYLSQDIGLASSDDLFEWKRLDSNPISPAKDKPWSFWREDGIASCRDPHLLEYDGRI